MVSNDFDLKRLSDWGFNTNKLTYVIAEIGINHGGNLAQAYKLIDSAAQTGCDAVKFQTYITEKRAPKGNAAIYDILKKCELPFSDFEKLQEHAKSHGLEFFSTPFDDESVDLLDALNVPFHKVASFDVTNRNLLRKLASRKKPIIMSVGMANLDEISDAVEILENRSKLTLLHCISAYPTHEKDANLLSISLLKRLFSNCVIGHSDHTNGIKVPCYAVACGAQVIEKHYRIDEEMKCIDAPVSIAENQMKALVNEIRNIEDMMGNEGLGVTEPQKPSLIFRRGSS